MYQNGQTHFKNLAAFAARFLNVSDHFGTFMHWRVDRFQSLTISAKHYVLDKTNKVKYQYVVKDLNRMKTLWLMLKGSQDAPQELFPIKPKRCP